MSEEGKLGGVKRKKQIYSELFNELLGTNIKFEKLSLPELAQLAVIFNNPSMLAEKLGLKNERLLRDRLLEAGVKLAKRFGFQGPVVTFLEELIEEGEKKKA